MCEIIGFGGRRGEMLFDLDCNLSMYKAKPNPIDLGYLFVIKMS